MRISYSSVGSVTALFLFLASGIHAPAVADPADLVPEGSVLIDAFARLADADVFGKAYTSTDFYRTRRFTRGELATLLVDDCLQDDSEVKDLLANNVTGPALIEATTDLKVEIEADGAPMTMAPDDVKRQLGSLSGYLAAEGRASDPASPPFSNPKWLADYRAADLGELSSNINYHVSLSDWPDDDRRFFVNQLGPHDFSPLDEAALTVHGGHDVTLDIGQLYDQWGPGYLGAMVISDNSPSMPQARLNFPFSLGGHLGRNYSYSEIAATFEEDDVRKFFLARQIGYQFSNKLSANIQEALKANYSGSLWLIPLPLNTASAKFSNLGLSGVHTADAQSNYVVNLGLNYAWIPQDRVYGQFLIDDLKNPGGLPDKNVPRKIGYLLGTAFAPDATTNLVGEYAYADPTTFTHHAPEEQWTNGNFDELGLPSGPNSRDLYGRIDQKLTRRLTLTADITDRMRKSLSFPEPTDREMVGALTYQLERKSWVNISYIDFKEDPFPISPSSASYPAPYNTPISESIQGERIRMHEWDFTVGRSF